MKRFFAAAFFLIALGSLPAEEPIRRSIAYTITHPMKTVTGSCQNAAVRGLAVSKANNVISAGAFQIVIPIAGMASGNRNRDSSMQTLLGYPAVSEWTAEVEPVAINGPAGTFKGVLRLGQKSAPLKSDFQITEEHGELVVRGSLTIRLSDYSIDRPRLLLLPVDDEVKVTYEFSVKSPG